VPTAEEVVAFTVKSLQEMNLDVEGVAGDTMLGPAGVDLDSLAVAELIARVEEQYELSFPEDELEQLAIMTLGEFGEMITRLSAQAPSESAPA
jgi:acyl carrier protein